MRKSRFTEEQIVGILAGVCGRGEGFGTVPQFKRQANSPGDCL